MRRATLLGICIIDEKYFQQILLSEKILVPWFLCNSETSFNKPLKTQFLSRDLEEEPHQILTPLSPLSIAKTAKEFIQQAQQFEQKNDFQHALKKYKKGQITFTFFSTKIIFLAVQMLPMKKLYSKINSIEQQLLFDVLSTSIIEPSSFMLEEKLRRDFSQSIFEETMPLSSFLLDDFPTERKRETSICVEQDNGNMIEPQEEENVFDVSAPLSPKKSSPRIFLPLPSPFSTPYFEKNNSSQIILPSTSPLNKETQVIQRSETKKIDIVKPISQKEEGRKEQEFVKPKKRKPSTKKKSKIKPSSKTVFDFQSDNTPPPSFQASPAGFLLQGAIFYLYGSFSVRHETLKYIIQRNGGQISTRLKPGVKNQKKYSKN